MQSLATRRWWTRGLLEPKDISHTELRVFLNPKALDIVYLYHDHMSYLF